METTSDEPKGEELAGATSGVWERRSTSVVSGLAAGTLLTGTVVYHLLEDWSWVDSLYFSVVTLATVGYGDLAPTTDLSKLFTVVYLVSGMSLLAAYFNEVMKRRERRAAKRSSRR
ncbi:MAG: two pore domain potassium channel family protein [Candidatus Microthrix sp.]|nr:potassium channel family protein [Candidatus Microthrix sp.]MBK9559200.1 two pore domain potassium channel family protein [Candidatus Microthrix sp.]